MALPTIVGKQRAYITSKGNQLVASSGRHKRHADNGQGQKRIRVMRRTSGRATLNLSIRRGWSRPRKSTRGRQRRKTGGSLYSPPLNPAQTASIATEIIAEIRIRTCTRQVDLIRTDQRSRWRNGLFQNNSKDEIRNLRNETIQPFPTVHHG